MAQASGWLAEKTGRIRPDIAWIAGILAPLGWYAAELPDDSAKPFPRLLARRLPHSLGLPTWLQIITGFLNLPLCDARRLGGDADSFAIVQVAGRLLAEQFPSIDLTGRVPISASLEWLGLGRSDVADLRRFLATVDDSSVFDPDWLDPRDDLDIVVALRDERSRRELEAAPFVYDWQERCDALHDSLVAERSSQPDRLEDAKLAALAEFAAGASHEINNPLAVISAQCQLLMQRETDQKRIRGLESVIRQTGRIHGILSELMMFARPPQPKLEPLTIDSLIDGVQGVYEREALALGVQFHREAVPVGVAVMGDRKLLGTALGCLIRNAMDAAGENGWIRIGAEIEESQLSIHVEDSGAGVHPASLDHLFDPFFSGRSAGRGRGLGLPTAWRFVRTNMGATCGISRCPPVRRVSS